MKTYQALESVKNEEGNIISVVEKNVDELPEGDLLIKVSYSSLNYTATTEIYTLHIVGSVRCV